MNTNINPKSLELIADLSNAFGPSGFEDAVFDVAKKHCGDMAQVTDDCLRNIYIRPNKPARAFRYSCWTPTATRWALWFTPSARTAPCASCP